ncbi:MAG: hypothetical protein AB1576_12580 [Bacillota bacterium]
MVPVYAYGPGAWVFDAIYGNTALPRKTADLAGLGTFPVVLATWYGEGMRLSRDPLIMEGVVWVPFRDMLEAAAYSVGEFHWLSSQSLTG